MSADLVTPAELAALARITEARARQVCREFISPGAYGVRRSWRGAVLRIHPGPAVEFSSLPVDLRDAALVARDQFLLPLPPPGTRSAGTACA